METGTSAYGTDSTRFWNSYISNYGGKVISVDIRENAGIQLRYQLNKNTKLETSDSVKYLKANPYTDVDLYYFDSADVDGASPEFSINQGLQELLAVVDVLRPGKIVVFDDTPRSEKFVEPHLQESVIAFKEEHGYYPGKGSLAIKILEEKFRIQVLHHKYAYACRILD